MGDLSDDNNDVDDTATNRRKRKDKAKRDDDEEDEIIEFETEAEREGRLARKRREERRKKLRSLVKPQLNGEMERNSQSNGMEKTEDDSNIHSESTDMVTMRVDKGTQVVNRWITSTNEL